MLFPYPYLTQCAFPLPYYFQTFQKKKKLLPFIGSRILQSSSSPKSKQKLKTNKNIVRSYLVISSQLDLKGVITDLDDELPTLQLDIRPNYRSVHSGGSGRGRGSLGRSATGTRMYHLQELPYIDDLLHVHVIIALADVRLCSMRDGPPARRPIPML